MYQWRLALIAPWCPTYQKKIYDGACIVPIDAYYCRAGQYPGMHRLTLPYKYLGELQ